ncbi:MAG: hypothetical protein V3W37_10020 [Candidatus Binatia bacterium]
MSDKKLCEGMTRKGGKNGPPASDPPPPPPALRKAVSDMPEGLTEDECELLRMYQERGEEIIALHTEVERLRGALRPFAGYACEPPCGCHNCTARDALEREND